MGSRLVVSKANLTQLWLGLLLVFREAVIFTGDVAVDSLVSLSRCYSALLVSGGLLHLLAPTAVRVDLHVSRVPMFLW